MKIAVRFQSRGNNTKTVAQAIAKEAGVTAEPVSVPIKEPVDILFIGGGIYAGGFRGSVKKFIKNLDPKVVKSLAAFSTAAASEGAPKIAAYAKAKNLNVSSETLSMKFGARNNAFRGGKGVIELTDEDLSLIKSYVNKVIK